MRDRAGGGGAVAASGDTEERGGHCEGLNCCTGGPAGFGERRVSRGVLGGWRSGSFCKLELFCRDFGMDWDGVRWLLVRLAKR